MPRFGFGPLKVPPALTPTTEVSFIHNIIHLSTSGIEVIMGYAVDYRPTQKRSARRSGKKLYDREIRRMVRANLDRLEHDTTGTATVERDMVIRLLRLDGVASYRSAGDNALQKLVHDGRIPTVTRVGGRRVFDRDELIGRLREYAGA